MNRIKRLLSLALSMVLCMSLVTPTLAADSIVPTVVLDKTEVNTNDGTQTVTMTLKNAEAFAICSASMDIVAHDDQGNTLTVASANSEALSDTTLTGNKVLQATSDSSNATTDTVIKVAFTIDSNTVPGTYTVGVENLELTYDTWNIYDLASTTVTTTLVVTSGTVSGGDSGNNNQGSTTEGYVASITVDPTQVQVGATGTVKVNVTCNGATDFAAGEVVLTIPNNVIVAETGAVKTTAGEAVGYKVSGTTLTIADFGTNKALGDGVYVVTYTAGNTAGEASFALVSAAFSDQANAEKANLIDATADTTAKVVTIFNAPVTVTEDANSSGYFNFTTPATYGVDYTFSKEIATGIYYTYSDVKYKVGESDWQPLTESNGSWTIPGSAVIGNITIKGTRTPISYNVTWDGDGAADIENKPATVPYGTNFTVTLPNDKAADTTPGYTYGISAKIGETPVGTYNNTNRTLTISGAQITGDITITVTKTPSDATDVIIGVGGDSALTILGYEGNAATVKIGNSVTIKLTKEVGYDYEVKDNNNNSVTFTAEGTYTFTASTNITFTVTKTLNVSSAAVTKYVQLNGARMWLITINANGINQIAGKTYTYNGTDMVWAENYNAYALLVVVANQDDEADKPDVTTGFDLKTVAEITTVNSNMNVNMADENTIDAADAQLVWNMYSTVYSGFTSDVTIEKFFRADVTNDKKVDTDDAAAIIKSILGITESN